MGRRFLGIVLVRTHVERATGYPDHPCLRVLQKGRHGAYPPRGPPNMGIAGAFSEPHPPYEPQSDRSLNSACGSVGTSRSSTSGRVDPASFG